MDHADNGISDHYLGQFGQDSPAVTRLVEFELDQAGVLGAIVDRYELGAYGRRSASPFGGRLTMDAAGDVTFRDASETRAFINMNDGTYRGPGVDFGALTQSNAGAFTLDGRWHSREGGSGAEPWRLMSGCGDEPADHHR